MTYIKTQEKIVCGSSYMDLVEINSCFNQCIGTMDCKNANACVF